ncbi:MAG: NAD-dependent epimerase/dehydratase family protein [Verrucomicrobiota bacterium]
MPAPLPRLIETESQLDDLLTLPRPELIDFIRTISSPLLVLGAGGKMGPTLAVLARRAAVAAGMDLEVIAVSRFSDPAARHWLEEREVRTLSADLLERKQVENLPESANVIYLVGFKFGTAEVPFLTWAMNTLVPANVAERYASARIVALSTGNVYGLAAVARGGSVESDPLAPLGEYPNAAVARERLFQYFAQKNRSALVLLRLNYAVELRYGVLVDIATKIWNRIPIDLSMGYLNCIWQGDANEFILRSLDLAAVEAPVFNLTGPEILSVRTLAGALAERLGRAPEFEGAEADTALLNNPKRLCQWLGEPPTPLDRILDWTAHWIKSGRRLLNKPTHFEVRDGKY